MQAKIKSLHLENFKGAKQATYNFEGKNVSVMGANATGKTTIADSLWWLLFNKDSAGNEKFSIRPLDKDGKQIDNVEICVAAVLDIDGKEMKLKKVQKQNWVKKRGTSETVLQGNVNSYTVDGYPKSEKEYKECVTGIVSEDLFKILTSPTYFPNMKWQGQREILMRFVTDISDVKLARQDERFADLIGELEKAPSTDDIKKKYQKALSEWKKKQAELPVRIDEVEKQKVDVDVAELELLKNSLNEQIAENKEKQEDISKEFEEQQKASDGVIELRMELNSLKQKANESLDNKRREIRRELDDLDFQLKEVKHQIRLNKQDIQAAEDSIKSNEARIQTEYGKWNDYDNELKAVEKYEIDENSLICSMCGQEFPVEKKKEFISDLDEKKRKKIEQLKNDKSATEKRGNELRAAIDKDKAKIEQLKSTLKENEDEEINLAESIKGLEKSLEEVPLSIDISSRPEVQEIQRQIAEKEDAMNKGNSAEEIRQRLKEEAEELQKQMDAVKEQFVLVKKNDEADDRIAELRKEQREVSQLAADQERMLFLLEEFIRYKMNMISDTINSKFDGVCFKMFDMQINGGMKETCECMVDGVPYGSLNSGHKIIAGLKIIKALQEHYNVYLPVFTDNAESVNTFNLPEMDCQMITLTVSDDKELKIVS
ncbi:MAG: AAA family ATPase [Lachnospiraceae bacterium]|nr:AAA family ATPase [Lachnospiraceae bacterium]